ncbi:MAG: PQQ-binding-like beta-propeller repeat protein [Planctomycetaceae bacterium]|nr:PQQ-binding-like beta-propeller repeat protein [Planctomycetaceae bacterium]
MKWLSLSALVAMSFSLLDDHASAGDWPQILGLHRSGIAAADEQLAEKWPKSGPPVAWDHPVGAGYAGVAVAGEQVLLFHRVRQEEVVESLSVANGESEWNSSYPTTFYPQVGGGDGPLCVPTIVGDRVVTYGAQGVLTCLNLKTGEIHWQRKTHEEFKAQEGYFGAGSSPIVVGERVIVNVGGSRTDAGIVAFSLETGETQWTKTQEPASYSAPTAVELAGQPHVLMVTRYRCLMLDPESGAIRFQFPFGQRGPTVNGATPITLDGHLLVSSSYGIGSIFAKFSLLGTETVWDGVEPLATQYCTPIHHQGYVYVIDGRDDVPPADLKCIDLETGKTTWVEYGFGYGTLILADGKLLAAKTNGELVMFSANPQEFEPLSHFRVFRKTVRALPAVSNGKLYLRDEETLKCLDLRLGL